MKRQRKPGRLLVWKVRPGVKRSPAGTVTRGWDCDMGRDGRWWYPTKGRALQAATSTARDAGPRWRISLRIFKADGTVQEERTYPRSADPRRSRG